MARPVPTAQGAFTLLELLMVVTLLGALTIITLPGLYHAIVAEHLPQSAEQMRSLISLVRVNAMFDGMRYRVRFAEDFADQTEPLRGPIIEREEDALREPGVFVPVESSWARDPTFLGDVWCWRVRLGKPTVESLREDEEVQSEESLSEVLGNEVRDIDRRFPPLVVEPDGTSEWAVFSLTEAPPATDAADFEEEPQIDVILDGVTGLIWLQRPFADEELDMLDEHGWPPVLRRDFLRPELLTENEVLEIRQERVRR